VSSMTAASPSTLELRGSRSRTAASDGSRLAVGAAATAVVALPLLVPHGPSNTSPVDVLILAAVGACLLWASISGHRWRFPYGAAIAVFMVGGALGAMAGPVPGYGLVALSQDLLLLAWCWTIVNMASSPARLRILLTTWAYSSIVWALVLLGAVAAGSHTIAGQAARQGGRTALTFVDPNVSANYYVISIMIICATQRPRRRSLRVIGYALLLAALFTTGSNSGIVSLVVAVVVARLVSLYHRRGAASAIAAFAAVVLSGFLIATNVSLKSIEEQAHSSKYTFIREGLGRGDKSVSQRQTLLHESTHLYETGGLLGQGPVSTKTRLDAEMAPFVKEAHNDYFAALTERGPIGLLGLFLLISSIGLRARVLGTSRIKPAYAGVLARPGAILGAVVGTMAASAVYELLHVRHVWALFAIVAAISVWGRE
jgi:O-Antigen ligase